MNKPPYPIIDGDAMAAVAEDRYAYHLFRRFRILVACSLLLKAEDDPDWIFRNDVYEQALLEMNAQEHWR